MALIELHVATTLLERIAIALERMAGPVRELPDRPIGKRVEASDVFVASNEYTDRVAGERTKAAQSVAGPLVQPGSDMEAEVIAALEEQVRTQYGEEAVGELPWRKVGRPNG